MKATLRGWLVAIVLMFAWPTLALAQEAAVRGTVTDETGGVVPGVTVTAQLSGLYFFGSGQRFATSYGADLRITGQSTGRLRPDGTIVPRNSLVGKPLHRVDLRIQRRFPLIGSARVDGMLEVFNLFNHENYGAYVTQESNRNYGLPTSNPNVAFQPRMLQLGFRLAF